MEDCSPQRATRGLILNIRKESARWRREATPKRSPHVPPPSPITEYGAQNIGCA
jgi:hypothetical protein